MDEKEKVVVQKVLEEMKNSHKMIQFWLKGTPIEATLADWISRLESLF